MPRNTFELQPAPAHLLIAGGIGITPILPILRATGTRRVHLLYLTRDLAHTEASP
ncbi:hypothetical protein ACWEO4_48325 [Streptomyces sp. NPDC004393]|uniref:hypothetical protein n=1 Tax=Streptomyces sp. NPDC004533 TaxID=3154278 RepID=UPI0033B21F02